MMMNTLLRIALLCALISSVIGWVDASSPAAAQSAAYTDTMDSEAEGLISTESPDPATISFAYQDGTFVVQAPNQPAPKEILTDIKTPSMQGTQVLFDVAIDGDVNLKYVVAGCRAGPNHSGYHLMVDLDTAEATLSSRDGEHSWVLGRTEAPVPLTTGATMNQIGIACEDTRISAIVNGVTVLTAFDTEYTAGSSYLGVGSRVGAVGGLTATFDNLTVADLGSSGFDTSPGESHELAPAPSNEPAVLSAPPYDPEAAYVQSAITSVLTPPVAEPVRRTGPVAPNQAANVPLGVQLDELYAELTFITPLQSSGLWLFGFCFWVDPAGNCTDFFIQSDGAAAHWGLGAYTANGYTLLDSGDMPAGSVDLTPGAENVMAVVVYQGSAVLGANGQVAASFFLNSQPAAGDVVERIEYSNDDPAAQPLIMTATDVAVWDLSDVGLMVDYETPDSSVTGTQGEEGVQSIVDRTCRYTALVKSADDACGGVTTV
jgi:hypothetical protein